MQKQDIRNLKSPIAKILEVKFCCLWICNFQISDNWLLWFQMQILKSPIGSINNSGFSMSKTGVWGFEKWRY